MAEAHDTLTQEAVCYGLTKLTAQHLAEFSKARGGGRTLCPQYSPRFARHRGTRAYVSGQPGGITMTDYADLTLAKPPPRYARKPSRRWNISRRFWSALIRTTPTTTPSAPDARYRPAAGEAGRSRDYGRHLAGSPARRALWPEGYY